MQVIRFSYLLDYDSFCPHQKRYIYAKMTNICIKSDSLKSHERSFKGICFMRK